MMRGAMEHTVIESPDTICKVVVIVVDELAGVSAVVLTEVNWEVYCAAGQHGATFLHFCDIQSL